MKHPIKPIGPLKRPRHPDLISIPWPSFTGNATVAGQSKDGRTTVYYDASLGAPCLANAQGLVANAPRINALCDSIFGVKLGKVNAIVFALGDVTDGTGGADHMGCDFRSGGNIEVCASFGQDNRVAALYMAEMSENYMGGNLCGVSTGEALSRWCANTVEPGALTDFDTAPLWQQDGSPDWVNSVNNTDQDGDSIGCGMAFISWMIHVLGLALPQIAQALVTTGGTWAAVYKRLTGTTISPWSRFLAACNGLSIINDDPFSVGVPAPPVPPVPPPPPPPAPIVLTSGTYTIPGGSELIIP